MTISLPVPCVRTTDEIIFVYGTLSSNENDYEVFNYGGVRDCLPITKLTELTLNLLSL